MTAQDDAMRAFAQALFRSVHAVGRDEPGVTRASYSPQESAAHALFAATATDLGLEVRTDALGLTYATLPGRDRTLPAVLTGSHLDSVPHGGDYDGVAGAVAGLCALRSLQQDGFRPLRDVTAVAIRAEEMCWFPHHYLGSQLAFGLLPAGLADMLVRSDDGASLSEHVARVGLDPDPFRRGVATLDGHRIAAFLEVHIEQGPRLDAAKVPVGIVTGIRGNMRYRGCRFVGEYSHAGGVPRDLRRDALFGAVEFARRLEKRWDDAERAGLDLVCTLGEFGTDPRLHAMTKIPGEVTFTIDARSLDDALLTELDGWMRDVAAEIAVRRSLDFEIPEPRRGRSTPMDGTLVAAIEEAAGALGVATLRLASGGGHDAATFASQGVPTAMIFVRNQNGSHNPFEAMELDDFVAATAVLARTLVGLSER